MAKACLKPVRKTFNVIYNQSDNQWTLGPLMTISRVDDVAWWQMTIDKGNKLASLVVTFCSLIQIILVLLIAVKNSNQLLCNNLWSIFSRSHLSGIKFTTIVKKNVHLRSKSLLKFTCVSPCVANTELVRSGACYWWRSARHGAHSYGRRLSVSRGRSVLGHVADLVRGPAQAGDTRRPGPVTWEDNGQRPGALSR